MIIATAKEPTDSREQSLLWASVALVAGDFSDHRLKLRAISFLAEKAKRPSDSIAQAAGSAAAAKADYRFLENESVHWDMINDPVHLHTAESIQGEEEILAVQDTTCLMFPRLKATTGLGYADREEQEALWLHSALAVRPDGHVIGTLHHHAWARPMEEFGQGKQRKWLPIEQKESYVWIRGIQRVAERVGNARASTRIVHVFDIGGDIHEVFQRIQDLQQDFIIRCGRNRRVEGEYKYLRQTLAQQRLIEHREISVPRKQGQPARVAAVEVRSGAVTFQPPSNYPSRQPLTLNAVRIYEPDPPPGVEGLEWILLTSFPVATPDQCRRVADRYKLRWRIEDFHLTLKSGCNIEKTQLKTADRIKVLLALCCAVAVRLLQLTHLARTEPEAPCTIALQEDEWRVLVTMVYKKPPSPQPPPPTMAEAVRMIGRLGGHLGRKCDGMPGVRVMWRGFRDLQLVVEYHRSLH